MNAFSETLFPGCPSFGYTSKPALASAIIELSGGQESRFRLWSRPLFTYEVQVGPRLDDAIQELLEHFLAMGGKECGFLFHDYVDFQSCRIGGTPTALDQPLVLDDESSDPAYQLVKDYTVGARTQRREIYKPEDGIIVANELNAVQTDFTLDTTTGLLTPGGGFAGTPSKWGGRFNVPVRYDVDELPIEVQNRNPGAYIHSTSFPLRELRRSDLGF